MNMIQSAKDQVLQLTVAAYEKAAAAGVLPAGITVTPAVEIPKDTANGDYTTTFCLAAAKAMKMNPRQVAQTLIDNMALEGSYFTSVELAGPGFLNFRLGGKWYADTVSGIEAAGARYGENDTLAGRKYMVEFVSANPTGPLHVGHGRGAAAGDSLARILRIKSADDRQNVSEEEIKYMVSEQDDLLDEEKRMIHEIFDLGDTVAREVMVPRVDTTMCEDDETVADVLSTMRQTGFSRIPVYHEDPDNVAGIAHIKDLIQPALDGKGDQPIAGFLRYSTFVPDTKDILPLLSEMQTSHDQIVVVVDEYGGTAGIITIEDIVEEIVGEIEDEFDPDNKYLTRLSHREWLVDGRFSCDDAIELGWPLEESDDYETIAGWILELCDSVPDIGEVFEVAGYKFKVQSMRGQRISLIRVIAPAETDKKDSESSAEKPAASGAGSVDPHDGDE